MINKRTTQITGITNILNRKNWLLFIVLFIEGASLLKGLLLWQLS